MFTAYSFFVPDLPCVNCAQPVINALQACVELEIDDVTYDSTLKKFSIRIPETLSDLFLRQKITDVLKKLNHTPFFSDTLSLKVETRLHWIQGLLGTASGVALLMISLLIGPLPLVLITPIALAAGALTLWLGAGSYRRAFDEWRKLWRSLSAKMVSSTDPNYSAEKKTGPKLSMDSLFAVSTAIVVIVSFASFFVPWLPMMLDTGLLIFGFRHLGLAIEGSLKRVMRLDVRFVDRLPKVARVKTALGFEDQLIKSIQPGAILEIQPGEIIPLDGVCLNDNHFIYEDIITGAYLPRDIKKNEKLLSGMRVARGSGPLLLNVSKPFETSHLKCRDQRIDKAKFEKKADFEIRANKILHYFIPAVFLFALISGVVISCFFPWAIAIRCIIGVLVSACPCTVGLIVPVTVSIAMGKAADHGVQFNSAEQLQRAGEVDCVVLDLNGTLTEGMSVVAHKPVFFESLISEGAFYQAIITLEKNSEHPIGRALHDYAKNQIPLHDDLVAVGQRQHFGVAASINGQEYKLGNQRMMDDLNIDVASLLNGVVLKAGDSVVYLVREKQVLGYVVLTDPIRPEAPLLVNSLKKLGKKIFMCTGADLATAERCADKLGIPRENVRSSQRCAFESNDKDDDKSQFIRELQAKKYKVAMVGDAGNDAFAIEASDFGLAIRSKNSDDVAQAAAGAVIYGSSLLPVISAFEISKQAVTNIKQNLIMSLTYNLVTELLMGGVLVAMGVMLNPGIGVALMIIQMGLILGNAYRFKQQTLSHLTPSNQKDEDLRTSVDRPSRELTNTYSLDKGRAIIPPPLWASSPAIAQQSPQYSPR